MSTTTIEHPSSNQGPALALGVLGAIVGGIVVAFAGIEWSFLVPMLALMIWWFHRPFPIWCLLVALTALDSLNLLVDSPVYALTGPKLVGFFLAIALFLHAAARRTTFRIDAHSIILMLFTGLVIASMGKAINQVEAIRFGLTLVQLVVFWIATRYVLDRPERIRRFAMISVTVLMVGALFAIATFFFTEDERASGFAQNAALLAAELFVAIGFGWALMRNSTGREKRFWQVAVLIAICGVMVTLSRAALLAAPFAFLAGALVMRARRLAIFGSITVIVVLLAIGPMLSGLRERSEIEGSTKAHVQTLKAGLSMIQDNPVLGVGAGNFPEYYLGYSHDERGLAKSAHNTWIGLAAETGLPAMAVFILLHVAAFASLWRTRSLMLRDEDWSGLSYLAACAFVLAGFMVYGVMHTLFVNKFLWLMLALALVPYDAWQASEKRAVLPAIG